MRPALPHAQRVVDHVHLVQLANNKTVTKVRHRVTWKNWGRRGRKVEPEWADRRRLLTGYERLSETSFNRMWNDALDGDASTRVLKAWVATEELRKLLAPAGIGGGAAPDAGRAATASRFLSWCADADVPEVSTLAETVDRCNPRLRRSAAPGSPTPAPRA